MLLCVAFIDISEIVKQALFRASGLGLLQEGLRNLQVGFAAAVRTHEVLVPIAVHTQCCPGNSQKYRLWRLHKTFIQSELQSAIPGVGTPGAQLPVREWDADDWQCIRSARDTARSHLG